MKYENDHKQQKRMLHKRRNYLANVKNWITLQVHFLVAQNQDQHSIAPQQITKMCKVWCH
jgi:hypothetical protein